ncbi:(2Fe-2S)-binding protein [Pararobbsia alpina]|uniref:(2Fe-2S)-binding protein n=1 Tax=Pararobbsia alpina TaxID=621374 RepID=UPI0015827326|nr:(2Fe-2S)-binding protein [Pararobbsia alpina]
MSVTLTVNGQQHHADIPAETLLVEFLRTNLQLTGTHVGCDTSQCGSCTVLIDDQAIKSCTMLAVQAEGRQVRTIEGLAAADGTLHPMQAAFREKHGLQCGFCTPGMVMSACELASRPGPLSDDEIRHALDGNLCRCTGYHNIVAAVKTGLAAMQAARGETPREPASTIQSQTAQERSQSPSAAPAAV